MGCCKSHPGIPARKASNPPKSYAERPKKSFSGEYPQTPNLPGSHKGPKTIKSGFAGGRRTTFELGPEIYRAVQYGEQGRAGHFPGLFDRALSPWNSRDGTRRRSLLKVPTSPVHIRCRFSSPISRIFLVIFLGTFVLSLGGGRGGGVGKKTEHRKS